MTAAKYVFPPNMTNEIRSVPRIVLGTVQFGMDYGVSNAGGRPPRIEVQRILECARDAGIDTLDTAAGYGDAEEILGSIEVASSFDIITKTPPVPENAIDLAVVDRTRQAFDRSLERLRREKISGALVHQSADLLKPGSDRLFRLLSDLKDEGLLKRVGVSIYAPNEAEEIVSRYPIDLIQLPFSILDQRALHSGLLDRLRAANVEVHARSVFLQGALLMPPSALPSHLSSVRPLLVRLRDDCMAREWGMQEACLRFALGAPGIDRLVCGVNSASELRELTSAAQEGWNNFDFSPFGLTDTRIIHPSEWPKQASA